MRSRKARSSRITAGIGVKRCDERTMTSTGWVRVSEHGDRGMALERLPISSETSGLAVGLQGRDDFLVHPVEVSDLVEADRIPSTDEPDLSTADVVEEPRYGGSAGEQDRVGGEFLVDVRLPCSARSQLDQIVVPLAHRDEPREDEELEPPVDLFVVWLQADRPDEEIEPLRRVEARASLDVLIERERGELDRFQLLDPERALLSRGALVVSVGDLDLRPDPPRSRRS